MAPPVVSPCACPALPLAPTLPPTTVNRLLGARVLSPVQRFCSLRQPFAQRSLSVRACFLLLQGSWSAYKTCKGGGLMCGFRQKIQPPQGSALLDDDTSLNRIQVRMHQGHAVSAPAGHAARAPAC